jgi:predicted enzyme related to lactoylglutathione lyase
MIGNAVWFEIPAANFERAVKFYEAVFQVSLKREKIGGDLAVFPGSDSSVNGAVVSQEGYVPAANGAVVYLNTGDDMAPYLERVTTSGGSIITPKTALPPGMGHYAHFGDTEGNRVGLFSQN